MLDPAKDPSPSPVVPTAPPIDASATAGSTPLKSSPSPSAPPLDPSAAGATPTSASTTPASPAAASSASTTPAAPKAPPAPHLLDSADLQSALVQAQKMKGRSGSETQAQFLKRVSKPISTHNKEKGVVAFTASTGGRDSARYAQVSSKLKGIAEAVPALGLALALIALITQFQCRNNTDSYEKATDKVQAQLDQTIKDKGKKDKDKGEGISFTKKRAENGSIELEFYKQDKNGVRSPLDPNNQQDQDVLKGTMDKIWGSAGFGQAWQPLSGGDQAAAASATFGAPQKTVGPAVTFGSTGTTPSAPSSGPASTSSSTHSPSGPGGP